MIEIVSISLENEMDLVLAHKRTMKVAEKLSLTTATQTTFATAVSEIARVVIEQTNSGLLLLGLEQNKQRYSLVAGVTFDGAVRFTNADEGFYYAQKLVPEFLLTESAGDNLIEMKLGLPRSLSLNPLKISLLKEYFLNEPPLNAYEEIKIRNLNLNKLAEEKEEELKRSKIIDEQKTEFISIASHELKTPITILKAYTQMAKALKDQPNQQLKGMLEKIDFQSGKLLSLVQQLLDISKTEHGNLLYNKEKVELTGFLTEMVEVTRHILPYHKVFVELGDSVWVEIDRLRMEQVISNLLGNAAKYSAKGTSIHVICTKDDNGVMTIAIKDEGIGLSNDSMQSVFNKFYRDKDVIKTHTGLGMGLYISSKIISGHGGKIWVESEEGVGSTFLFTLPHE
jgi:signal transduction histidine kinase